ASGVRQYTPSWPPLSLAGYTAVNPGCGAFAPARSRGSTGQNWTPVNPGVNSLAMILAYAFAVPFSPWIPWIPWIPCTPWIPCRPCGPVAPVSPFGPAEPAAPVAPVSPFAPAGPVGPADRTPRPKSRAVSEPSLTCADVIEDGLIFAGVTAPFLICAVP